MLTFIRAHQLSFTLWPQLLNLGCLISVLVIFEIIALLIRSEGLQKPLMSALWPLIDIFDWQLACLLLSASWTQIRPEIQHLCCKKWQDISTMCDYDTFPVSTMLLQYSSRFSSSVNLVFVSLLLRSDNTGNNFLPDMKISLTLLSGDISIWIWSKSH